MIIPLLVGGAITISKNMKINGKDIPNILWKIKFMIETTNQLIIGIG